MLTEPSNAQPRSNACTHSPTAEQACAPGNDMVWQAALDWHLRLHEQPADAALQATLIGRPTSIGVAPVISTSSNTAAGH